MKNITYEQFSDAAFRRAEQMKIKTEAVWVAFLEMRGLVNISGFAEKYFERTHGWFSQKLNSNRVDGKVREFTPEECNRIATAFRSWAAQLVEYADAIERAE